MARLLTQFGTMARAPVLQAFTSSCDVEVDTASRSSLLHAITAHLLPQLRAALEDWAAASLTSFPPASAWRSTDSPDSSLPLTLAAHTSLLASSPGAVPPSAIKHTLFSATRFACDLLLWCPDSSPLQQRLVTALFPLLLDSTTEHLADLVTLSLERLVGTGETEQFLAAIYQLVLQHAYPVLVSRVAAQPDMASVLVPQEILRFLDTMLDRPTGRAALASFFVASPGPGPRLTEVLLSLSGGQGHQAPEYAQRVLRFFSKLFSQSHPGEEGTVAPLTSHLSSLTEVAPPRLEVWLRYLVCGMFQAGPDTEEDTLQENRALLQSLTTAIVASHSGVPEAVPLSVLSLLVPLATELLSPLASPTVGFPDLMAVMGGLAGAGGGRGHLTLLPATVQWLQQTKQFLVQKNVVGKLEQGVTSGRHTAMMENCSHLLNYICDLVVALRYGSGRWCLPSSSSRPSSPGLITATAGEDEKDDVSWTEEGPDDEDSAAEDSDDEAMDGKLCTYTHTARVFMNQHWYHCHTCGMVEGVGCCSVCARVCHRDHDVTYSKHGSFFCDCGAREDGSCVALAARNPAGGEEGARRKVGQLYAGLESRQPRSSSPKK